MLPKLRHAKFRMDKQNEDVFVAQCEREREREERETKRKKHYSGQCVTKHTRARLTQEWHK